MSTTRPAEPPYRVPDEDRGGGQDGGDDLDGHHGSTIPRVPARPVHNRVPTRFVQKFWRMMVKMEDRLGSRIDRVEARFGQRIDRLDQQIDALLAGRPA